MNLHMFDDWDQEVVQVLANDIISKQLYINIKSIKIVLPIQSMV